MSNTQDLTPQEKKELKAQEEKTYAGKFYVPGTDIFESGDAITMAMEMPGVTRDNIDIKLEKRQLSVQGQIDFDNYADFKPVYTEYNVGHFSRNFTLSSEIDTDNIKASVADGVLTLVLPKAKETQLRKIQVN